MNIPTQAKTGLEWATRPMCSLKRRQRTRSKCASLCTFEYYQHGSRRLKFAEMMGYLWSSPLIIAYDLIQDHLQASRSQHGPLGSLSYLRGKARGAMRTQFSSTSKGSTSGSIPLHGCACRANGSIPHIRQEKIVSWTG
jgi:hypothetical protein